MPMQTTVNYSGGKGAHLGAGEKPFDRGLLAGVRGHQDDRRRSSRSAKPSRPGIITSATTRSVAIVRMNKHLLDG
jgi:hypothetical protein